MANFFKLLLIQNDLVGTEYVEPYAGGAGVGLGLLYEGLVSRIHLNDLDENVHAFWHTALSETARICELVSRTPVTVEEWDRQQAILSDPDVSDIERGFATFFLNRTNRSGVLGAGMIGGRDQTGAYGIGARYNKRTLIRRLEKLGRHAQRIRLTRMDAVSFLRSDVARLGSDTLVYLDPPYFGQGQRLYLNAYSPGDHASVAAAVADLRCRWVVSYDAEPEVLDLYSRWRSLRYSLHYSAAAHYEGTEVMFFSVGLTPPDDAPPRVSAKRVDQARLRLVAG